MGLFLQSYFHGSRDYFVIGLFGLWLDYFVVNFFDGAPFLPVLELATIDDAKIPLLNIMQP